MERFKPIKPEKEIISIRINRNTLIRVDKLASNIDISRNELINQCIEFALANLEHEISDN